MTLDHKTSLKVPPIMQFLRLEILFYECPKTGLHASNDDPIISLSKPALSLLFTYLRIGHLQNIVMEHDLNILMIFGIK